MHELLRTRLQEMSEISNETWLSGLDERKRRELAFHDAHRDRAPSEALDQDTYKRFYGNRNYYVATELSKRYVDVDLDVGKREDFPRLCLRERIQRDQGRPGGR